VSSAGFGQSTCVTLSHRLQRFFNSRFQKRLLFFFGSPFVRNHETHLLKPRARTLARIYELRPDFTFYSVCPGGKYPRKRSRFPTPGEVKVFASPHEQTEFVPGRIERTQQDRDVTDYVSLTASTKLRASDLSFGLLGSKYGYGLIELGLATARRDGTFHIPRPCIYVRSPRWTFRRFDQHQALANIRLFYCLINALFADPAFQWDVATPNTISGPPTLVLKGLMKAMIPFLLAISWVQSLREIRRNTKVIRDLEESGLITRQQSRLCQEYSTRLDDSPGER
jgi:hypothetical protein